MDGKKIEQLRAGDVRHALTHAGLMLLAYELMRHLVIDRIKGFYADTTFGDALPFKSYEHDVLARHKNVFEASLLYLRDHMEAISREEMEAIQELRRYRNVIAHELPKRLLDRPQCTKDDLMLTKTRAALFRLSNFWVNIDLRCDPDWQHLDFHTVGGTDLMLLDRIIEQLRDTSKRSSQ